MTKKRRPPKKKKDLSKILGATHKVSDLGKEIIATKSKFVPKKTKKFSPCKKTEQFQH